jgi:hypothetical protein
MNIQEPNSNPSIMSQDEKLALAKVPGANRPDL